MSFIGTFEALSKLYEFVEPETKAVADTVSTEEVSDELDEGIFDKKSKAELNNMRSNFESEVELIAKKSLQDIAYDLVDLLGSAAGEYKVYAEKKANHQTDNTSMAKIFENKSKQVLQLYTKLIASFKKPNNFYQAASAIDNAAATILEAFAQDSSIPKKIEQYREILLKVNEIQADTKVKQEALKEFFNNLIRYLNDAAQTLKKDPESLFEEASGQAEIGEDDTDIIDIEIEDDTDTVEVTEDPAEAKQLIIECANCGGLVIKADADVIIDEESGLANIKEVCQYCEETAGYKIVGIVVPYDAATEEEELEETTETEEELA